MTKQIQLVVFVAYDDTQIIIRIIQVKNTTVATEIEKANKYSVFFTKKGRNLEMSICYILWSFWRDFLSCLTKFLGLLGL